MQGGTYHGNSKQSDKEQHGYRIYDKTTGETLEYGISGQELKNDGTSPRVDQKINTKYGGNSNVAGEVLEPSIKGNTQNGTTARQEALTWEQNKVDDYSTAKQQSGQSNVPVAPPMQKRPTAKK